MYSLREGLARSLNSQEIALFSSEWTQSRRSGKEAIRMENTRSSSANQEQITVSASGLDSLKRAVSGQSLTNFPAIFSGFAAKGIPESEIKPRENVFTFNAWKVLGRVVRRGEHGVKITTFIESKSKRVDADSGEPRVTRRPWTTTVFHISQTEPLNGSNR
jgi:hypothetical protein